MAFMSCNQLITTIFWEHISHVFGRIFAAGVAHLPQVIFFQFIILRFIIDAWLLDEKRLRISVLSVDGSIHSVLQYD